jgi:alkylation response protein AidB-like acyl-CoA dehydrogenase
MDLEYGHEYDDFRAEVRSFLEAHWPPKGDRGAQAQAFRRAAIERGYLARSIPRQYGGSEQPADPIRARIIAEEFGRARAPGDPRGIGTMMLVPTLLEKGAEWQKEKWVPPTIQGDVTWCQGYSEPGAGSDLASLKTRAELAGDEWVINGQKIWTSAAQHADFMFCLCRTEPEAPKHAGISYLLIDMKQPGIDVRPLRMMSGTAEFNEVFLNDARTPADWIVGKRGEGWLVSRATLKHERDSIGSAAQTAAVFRGLVQLAKSRTRHGRPAIEDPEIRQRLARIEGYVRSHEYSGFIQLTRSSRGARPGPIGAMNKIVSTNIGHEVAKLSLDLLEDDGLLSAQSAAMGGHIPKEAPAWLTQYMWSLGIAVAGGTANIQRNIIAERVLGLPRDYYQQTAKGRAQHREEGTVR